MILRLTLALIVCVLLLTGCSPGESSPAADAPPAVSTAWLARNLGGDGLVLLDVRSDPQRFDSGHLPGAVHLALPGVRTAPGQTTPIPSALLMSILRQHGVPARAHVVVYAGATGEAESVTRLLREAGQERVSVLEGGLERWSREGRPVSRRGPTPRAWILVGGEDISG